MLFFSLKSLERFKNQGATLFVDIQANETRDLPWYHGLLSSFHTTFRVTSLPGGVQQFKTYFFFTLSTKLSKKNRLLQKLKQNTVFGCVRRLCTSKCESVGKMSHEIDDAQISLYHVPRKQSEEGMVRSCNRGSAKNSFFFKKSNFCPFFWRRIFEKKRGQSLS